MEIVESCFPKTNNIDGDFIFEKKNYNDDSAHASIIETVNVSGISCNPLELIRKELKKNNYEMKIKYISGKISISIFEKNNLIEFRLLDSPLIRSLGFVYDGIYKTTVIALNRPIQPPQYVMMCLNSIECINSNKKNYFNKLTFGDNEQLYYTNIHSITPYIFDRPIDISTLNVSFYKNENELYDFMNINHSFLLKLTLN